MKFTAEQIAGILDGQVIGDPNAEVYKLSKIEESTAGSLTFLSNPKYQNYIYTTKATVTIVNKNFEPENPISTTLIKVDDPYQAFSKLLEYYNQVKDSPYDRRAADTLKFANFITDECKGAKTTSLRRGNSSG